MTRFFKSRKPSLEPDEVRSLLALPGNVRVGLRSEGGDLTELSIGKTLTATEKAAVKAFIAAKGFDVTQFNVED